MEDIELKKQNLTNKAKDYRRRIATFVTERKEGHIGGAFSVMESILTIFDVFLTDNDKFILSKGHAWLPLYFLLKERGYNPTMSGHPELDCKNGISCTTGSLGHGLPMAVGMALAKKIKNEPGKVYVILGDGECQEGTTWESMMLASHHKLDNLKIIIDHNKVQTLGKVNDILSLGDVEEKFRVFGGSTSVIDGHSFDEIISSLEKTHENQPQVIIANTIKGNGVSIFMQNKSGWHTKVPNEEELKIALDELK